MKRYGWLFEKAFEIKKIIRGGKNESVQIRKQCFA